MVEHQHHSSLARFFAPERPVAGSSLSLGAEAAHHMRVRRLVTGERVRLADGAGAVATAVISRLSPRSAVVSVESVTEALAPVDVHLLVPVADRDRMLALAEKAVELGAASWRPVVWRRSRSVSPRGEGAGFHAKVRARMISALLQCGGGWLPTAFPDATVEHAITAAPEGTRVLLDMDGEPIARVPLATPLTIAIGPEGGVEPDERAAFVSGHFLPARLAGNILRFETAATAALAIALARLADQTGGT
jgi:16S rRNA (uracil1498-N3)-methyltransferase